MVMRGHVERIEIPVEPLSYVPGEHVGPLRSAGRWCASALNGAPAASGERTAAAPLPASGATVTVGTGDCVFRRVVDVPGHRLESVLRAWWRRSSHDDGHLRVSALRFDDGAVALEGSFRSTSTWRRVPIVIRLWPYGRDWSILELTPQRPTRANHRYFSAGHDSLDRFVAALCALV
jgi:hypothetical protein